MDNINILVAGVGGQGVVLASDILGDVAMANGCDVKKTDTLGMAQRCGSVVTHLRIGERLAAPLICEGGADLLLAFEKLEAVRWSSYLKYETLAVVNNQCVLPVSVSLGIDTYPSNDAIADMLRHRVAKVMFVEGQRLAAELGNSKTLNVLMLGVLSVSMPFSCESWKDIIGQRLPSKILDINLAAFERGRSIAKDG